MPDRQRRISRCAPAWRARDGDRDVVAVDAVDDQFERPVTVAHDEDEAQAVIVCIHVDAEPVDGAVRSYARLRPRLGVPGLSLVLLGPHAEADW